MIPLDWENRPRCDQAAAWPLLQAYYANAFAGADAFDLRLAFAGDPQRAGRLGFQAPHVFADLSKNLIDDEARRLLTELARQCGVARHRDAMLAGELVNVSEQRPVTHVHWRQEVERAGIPPYHGEAVSIIAEAAPRREAMLDVAEAIRGDGAITDVVNLGIGGSDLGPRLVVQAMGASGCADGPRVHFVANMDGHDLSRVLERLKPASTLFIIASKSFGTAETIRNATSARTWFKASGGRDVSRHFVAVSANVAAAAKFGAGRCLSFDDGVGGRYSLWSPIGLAIAVAIGPERFLQLLAGARSMDQHFAEAPLAQNLPVQLALLDLWYRQFHGFASRCVVPYHDGLRRLPAHLQQLEMESNGKRVDLHRRSIPMPTAAVTWGDVGSNSQHAFFQMLHQGSDVVPAEFLIVKDREHGMVGHHEALLANALAQSRALMMGQIGDAPERHFPGNRPSTVLLLPDLMPASVGALLALYEHRTFVLGSLLGINSFDQWGVELGKRHAGEVLTALQGGAGQGLDTSTRGLVARLRNA